MSTGHNRSPSNDDRVSHGHSFIFLGAQSSSTGHISFPSQIPTGGESGLSSLSGHLSSHNLVTTEIRYPDDFVVLVHAATKRRKHL